MTGGPERRHGRPKRGRKRKGKIGRGRERGDTKEEKKEETKG